MIHIPYADALRLTTNSNVYCYGKDVLLNPAHLLAARYAWHAAYSILVLQNSNVRRQIPSPFSRSVDIS